MLHASCGSATYGRLMHAHHKESDCDCTPHGGPHRPGPGRLGHRGERDHIFCAVYSCATTMHMRQPLALTSIDSGQMPMDSGRDHNKFLMFSSRFFRMRPFQGLRRFWIQGGSFLQGGSDVTGITWQRTHVLAKKKDDQLVWDSWKIAMCKCYHLQYFCSLLFFSMCPNSHLRSAT